MAGLEQEKKQVKVERSVIDVVQLDAPALLNLSKHCKDNVGTVVQGVLMGFYKEFD